MCVCVCVCGYVWFTGSDYKKKRQRILTVFKRGEGREEEREEEREEGRERERGGGGWEEGARALLERLQNEGNPTAIRESKKSLQSFPRLGCHPITISHSTIKPCISLINYPSV